MKVNKGILPPLVQGGIEIIKMDALLPAYVSRAGTEVGTAQQNG
ncbi:hypothetical protein [Hymenobacter piscis]|nr:hypothetical protein [Hymenobacter piscis]